MALYGCRQTKKTAMWRFILRKIVEGYFRDRLTRYCVVSNMTTKINTDLIATNHSPSSGVGAKNADINTKIATNPKKAQKTLQVIALNFGAM